MKLLCYGDSNTYGYDPRLSDDDRLPKDERWTGILDLLPEYDVVNQGQNGREIPTMPYEYDFFRKILQYHQDCQILTIMLGTNDLYHIFVKEAGDAELEADELAKRIAARMERLFETVTELEHFRIGSRKTILMVPVPVHTDYCYADMVSMLASERLKYYYRDIAVRYGLEFFDPAESHIPLAFDGVHISPEGHMRFAKALKAFLEELE